MATGIDIARKSGRKNRSVTINDVARRAGVSPMTVSRVVNGEKNVSAATRETVLSIIEELQYAPNTAARTLAGAGAARLGMLYSNPSAAYLSEFLVGVLEKTSRTGVQLLLEKCDIGHPATERAAVHKLIRIGVAGAVLSSPISDPLIHELIAAGIPIISVGSGNLRHGLSCVRIDNFKAAYEMTAYLLALGHRRVGFVKGHPSQVASVERLRGFEAALHDAKVPIEEPVIAQGFFSYRSGLDAAENLLSGDKQPTAIFASNDDMAAAVISVAHRKGLDVPHDLSVVGFDDTPIASTIWPELTTIRQPIAAMAEIAVGLLMRESRRAKAGLPVALVDHVVDYAFVERQSAAAPRRAARRKDAAGTKHP